MQEPLALSWNLDSIFAGGSKSPEFSGFLADLKNKVSEFHKKVTMNDELKINISADEFIGLIELMQSMNQQFKESESFVGCLSAQDQADKEAVLISGQIKELYADYLSALTLFDQGLTNIEDSRWHSFMQLDDLLPVAFALNERRDLRKDRMSPELESLSSNLAVDGYHAWGELYNTIVGTMKIPFEEDGQLNQLSAGQAANKLSHANRGIRSKMFLQWEEAWSRQADFCADALNHLAGFRLQLYKHRGWESVHKEPLEINRMSAETLRVMWEVIEKNRSVFVDYLQRKAELLGLEQLGWVDVDAPVGQTAKQYTFDEAAEFIIEQFRKFSPRMADFAAEAFRNRWIEAEDRPGKRPGGFCTSFPIKEQTRIFMTFAGTSSNVSTLAHELGHAYHQHVMNDLPGLVQDYAMNVAETASTFAELIVSSAAVKMAESQEEQLVMLEDKIQRSVAFFMNIHARFLFESNFYQARSKGLVSVAQLNEMMEQAQKTAFSNALSDYHPHFWASKLHFYLTDVPFYNFPYTFGYMFSAGIYAKALHEEGFEQKYIELLRDTGRMSAEALARKHLDVDLTKPDFWQSAMDLAIADVKQFLDMTS
ncbi:MAG TPA: M3 family oligoendopeptidase [Bacilli bacterium]